MIKQVVDLLKINNISYDLNKEKNDIISKRIKDLYLIKDGFKHCFK